MKKDWTGSSASVFKSLGATNHASGERANMDYYATDPVVIDKLASKFEIPHNVWEPCCGQGHLSERLLELGHKVMSTDIVDRGYGGVMDFLSLEAYDFKGKFECILTNPPYKYVAECILRALELLPDGGYACFFLKTTALESRKRYDLIFKNTPPPCWCCSLLNVFSVLRMVISFKQRRMVRLSVTLGLYGKMDIKVKQQLIGYEQGHWY